jgi:hypothetical protein
VANGDMTRDDLLTLLRSSDLGEACDRCLAAVQGGSPYRIFGEHSHPEELVRIYEVRVAGATKRGVESIGGEDLIGRLRAEQRLAVGIVNGPAHNIVLFFNGDLSRCVACWAIQNDWEPPDE